MKLAPQKQQGVALIIVLLIVAIVSVLATEMGSRLQLQIKRASNIKENNQAYWYAMAAEQFAQKSLVELYKVSSDVIHLEQAWNQEFTFPMDGGGIQAQLIDLQSCFNLNALGITNKSSSAGIVSNQTASQTTTQTNTSPPTPKANTNASNKQELGLRIDAFERLLNTIDADIPSYNIDILKDSLADWLDTDSQARALGAEDNEYESRQFPYMAANNLMVDKSELRLINGVELQWLKPLLDLSCVIPNDPLLKINVNTVSEENISIIAGLTGLTLSQAESALSARGNEGFEKIAEFLNTPELKAVNLTDEQEAWFDVTTAHFMLHTKAKFNNATFAMQTIFKINGDNKVNVIRREFSGF